MVCMTEQAIRQRIARLIADNSPRPTELLKMANDLSYGEVQDVIAELLDSGQVELDVDRRLKSKRPAA
jgi:hypothetical protein